VDGEGNVLPPNPELVRGENIALLLGGFEGGADVTVTLNSTPRDLGVVMADEEGFVEFGFSVPEDLEAGPHTLVFVGPAPGAGIERLAVVDGVNTVSYAFTVSEDEPLEETPSAADGGTDAAPGSGGGLPETGGSPFGPATTGVLLMLAGLALILGSSRVHPRSDRIH
jgi:hypothetical protein